MYLIIKILLDFMLALIGLIILSPLFLVLIIAIKLDSPGPVIFKQKRVGEGKTYFNMLKFRTMSTNAPTCMATHMLKNSNSYITRTGRVMRKMSLDELPQLFCILSGKMSIVGPRPALWNQYDLIAERDKYGANDIRPGLTGWAQIIGRDEIEIDLKAKLDGEYVQRMSFELDIKFFFATIVKVLRCHGVIEGGTGEIKKADTITYEDSTGIQAMTLKLLIKPSKLLMRCKIAVVCLMNLKVHSLHLGI